MLKDTLEVAFDLLERHAWLQPSCYLNPPVCRVAQSLRIRSDLSLESQRNREIVQPASHALGADERWINHSDDGDWDVVDSNAFADDVVSCRESRSPVAVAEHRDGRCRGMVVFWSQRAPNAGSHTKKSVVIAGRHQNIRGFRTAVDHNGDASGSARREIRHRLIRRPEVLEHGVRECGVDGLSVRGWRGIAVVARVVGHLVLARPPDAHKRIGIANRQFPQQQAVNGCEDSRVRGDADSEREHDDGRPAFGLQQHADPVAEVFQHGEANYQGACRFFRT